MLTHGSHINRQEETLVYTSTASALTFAVALALACAFTFFLIGEERGTQRLHVLADVERSELDPCQVGPEGARFHYGARHGAEQAQCELPLLSLLARSACRTGAVGIPFHPGTCRGAEWLPPLWQCPLR